MDRNENRIRSEFLVIGSGIAGLRAAIELRRRGRDVVLVSKSSLEDSNTYYAQGGLAAVAPERDARGEDRYESHIRDTLEAGDGLCAAPAVERFVRRSYADAIGFLIEAGVQFSTKRDGGYVLHQEGGHEHPRIYCVGDFTGKAVEQRLVEIVRRDPGVKVLEHHTAFSLVTRNQIERPRQPGDRCLGAHVLDRHSGRVRTMDAGAVFLATGGCGRVFQYTSNPDNATGDGIAMAYRAGARLANMEFFQFHPTVMYEPDAEKKAERRFLLTEALRGAEMGGILTVARDSRRDFMLEHHPDGSHATRDIVARAIDSEMKRGGLSHVWLNVSEGVTGKSPEYLRSHFPDIYLHCEERGLDMARDPIPVVPAAHYTCGGVLVDEHGQTDIGGLYAIGEVACTGLMGGNRLASNSLPEAALYGLLAVEHATASPDRSPPECGLEIPVWKTDHTQTEVDTATLNQFWDATRSTMTNLCGIDRNEQRLQAAVEILRGLNRAANTTYQTFRPVHEIIELRNLTLVARIIAESALQRRESRGTHFRADYPERIDESYQENTVIAAAPENL